MVSYTIAMIARLVCLALCLVVPGWWVLIPAAGVILLPAIAVMTANIVTAPDARRHTRHSLHLPALPGRKS